MGQVVMAKILSGEIRIFDGKRWQTHRAEFLVESETDPVQEAHDQKLLRAAERSKRGDDLAREFTGEKDAAFITCPYSTRMAMLFILDQELPLI